jgi:hypothetical protein
MRKVFFSLLLGAAAGVLDVLPMIPLGTGLHDMASAFVHWVVLGLVIAHLELPLPSWLKGLVIAVLSAIPVAILVARTDPVALVPMTVMSALLGSGVGHVSGRWSRRAAVSAG